MDFIFGYKYIILLYHIQKSVNNNKKKPTKS